MEEMRVVVAMTSEVMAEVAMDVVNAKVAVLMVAEMPGQLW